MNQAKSQHGHDVCFVRMASACLLAWLHDEKVAERVAFVVCLSVFRFSPIFDTDLDPKSRRETWPVGAGAEKNG